MFSYTQKGMISLAKILHTFFVHQEHLPYYKQIYDPLQIGDTTFKTINRDERGGSYNLAHNDDTYDQSRPFLLPKRSRLHTIPVGYSKHHNLIFFHGNDDLITFIIT